MRPPPQIGNMGTMMSLLSVNVFMAKQQAPEVLTCSFSWLACSEPSSCGRGGAPRPSWNGAHRTSEGQGACWHLIVTSLQESGAQLRLEVEGRPCAGGGALMGPWLAMVPEAGTGVGGGHWPQRALPALTQLSSPVHRGRHSARCQKHSHSFQKYGLAPGRVPSPGEVLKELPPPSPAD